MIRYVAYKIKPEEFLNNEISNKALNLDGKYIHRVRILGKASNITQEGVKTFQVNEVVVKDFENTSENKFQEGDLVDIIGRIGIYNEERYVSLEVISNKSENAEKWIQFREKEIEETRKYVSDEGNQTYNRDEYQEGEFSGSGGSSNDGFGDMENEALEELFGELDAKDKVLDIIKNNNEIGYYDIIDLAEISEEELDGILEELIDNSEIYEPKPRVYREM
ncbi:DNA replicative helicase MCM subunit Mcm2 (Cdc46/Mcm family) [Methanococcus voltae]|uniref:winged helix-turn-helix domain-containing protein n=1 Tax=Methanococcus voltae TaxID=2188 RepID=UPI001FDA1ADB|nr:winged helix-turn-helix domain-containing protein [Methanococcus voltae]MBP2143554.1 DNA replicative helicase MCM subunit Mcm2 (Cdc46/Mcm family) [Methanococcus voltae]